MTVLDSYGFDAYGNSLQMGYDILKQENNQTTYRRYIVLNIVPGGSLSWSNARARFFNPNAEQSLSYSYGSGSHTLLSQDVTVSHDSQGRHTETISGNVTSGYINWNFSKSVEFPQIQAGATINSFEGSSITGPFKAHFNSIGSGYEYRLRISIPYVIALDTIRNYQQNQVVYLSQSSIDYIRNYTTNKTVEIGGVIETWKDGGKIGESEEIIIYCKTTSGISLRVNGNWKEATPYVRVNGVWKEATPYTRVNNQWKEGI